MTEKELREHAKKIVDKVRPVVAANELQKTQVVLDEKMEIAFKLFQFVLDYFFAFATDPSSTIHLYASNSCQKACIKVIPINIPTGTIISSIPFDIGALDYLMSFLDGVPNYSMKAIKDGYEIRMHLDTTA